MKALTQYQLWWLQDHAGQRFCASCLLEITVDDEPVVRKAREGLILEGAGCCDMCKENGVVTMFQASASARA